MGISGLESAEKTPGPLKCSQASPFFFFFLQIFSDVWDLRQIPQALNPNLKKFQMKSTWNMARARTPAYSGRGNMQRWPFADVNSWDKTQIPESQPGFTLYKSLQMYGTSHKI